MDAWGMLSFIQSHCIFPCEETSRKMGPTRLTLDGSSFRKCRWPQALELKTFSRQRSDNCGLLGSLRWSPALVFLSSPHRHKLSHKNKNYDTVSLLINLQSIMLARDVPWLTTGPVGDPHCESAGYTKGQVTHTIRPPLPQ